MPRGVYKRKEQRVSAPVGSPHVDQVSEHNHLIESTKQLIQQVEQNVDRLRAIRQEVGMCINESETFLGAIASGAPKPPHLAKAPNVQAFAIGR